jgi:hypothetical protein
MTLIVTILENEFIWTFHSKLVEIFKSGWILEPIILPILMIAIQSLTHVDCLLYIVVLFLTMFLLSPCFHSSSFIIDMIKDWGYYMRKSPGYTTAEWMWDESQTYDFKSLTNNVIFCQSSLVHLVNSHLTVYKEPKKNCRNFQINFLCLC